MIKNQESNKGIHGEFINLFHTKKHLCWRSVPASVVDNNSGCWSLIEVIHSEISVSCHRIQSAGTFLLYVVNTWSMFFIRMSRPFVHAAVFMTR